MPSPPYVFAQLLGLLPRYEFQRIVNKYNGDDRTKSFRCWNQLACMMCAHIRQENSLRDIDIALNAHASKLYISGFDNAPSPRWPMPTNAAIPASTRNSPRR